jgi:phosphonate metabolism protein (transferase hexapeptide repeat family)
MLAPAPLIDPTARVERCALGRYTEVGARTSLIETALGDYSYVVNDADIIYTRIGKFCSIAAHTRINPGDHPMGRVSQSHFTYRASAYFAGEDDEAAFFDWRRSRTVTIGHDVWIGHGAIVLAVSAQLGFLHKAKQVKETDQWRYIQMARDPERTSPLTREGTCAQDGTCGWRCDSRLADMR